MKDKNKMTSPNDLEIKVKAGGKEYAISDEPVFLGTKEVVLTKQKPIKPISFFLPPGVSHFFVEKTDKHHRVKIRFLIKTEEVERLAEKAEKMMGGENQVEKSAMVVGNEKSATDVKRKNETTTAEA